MPLWDLAERLIEFADAGVQVLNCSLGPETYDGQPPSVPQRAIAWLSPSMAIVAAAGNHGDPPVTAQVLGEKPKAALAPASVPLFQAALDGVLAGGARDENGGRVRLWKPGADRPRRGSSRRRGSRSRVGECVDLSLEDEEPGPRRGKFYVWA
jgi:hypothetical protein